MYAVQSVLFVFIRFSFKFKFICFVFSRAWRLVKSREEGLIKAQKREGQGKRTKRFAALCSGVCPKIASLDAWKLRGVGRRRSRHPCSCWCPSDKCFRMSCRAPFGRSQVRYPAHGLHYHNGSFSDLSAYDFIELLQRPRDCPRRTDSLKNRESRFGQKAMAVRHDLCREWEVRQLFMGELRCIWLECDLGTAQDFGSSGPWTIVWLLPRPLVPFHPPCSGS